MRSLKLFVAAFMVVGFVVFVNYAELEINLTRNRTPISLDYCNCTSLVPTCPSFPPSPPTIPPIPTPIPTSTPSPSPSPSPSLSPSLPNTTLPTCAPVIPVVCPTFPPAEPSTDLTQDLPCIDAIRNNINQPGLTYPQTFLDMLDLLLTYGSTVGARDKFNKQLAGKGRFFLTKEALKKKFDSYQTCWASDEKNGRIWDQSQPFNNETKAPRLGICTTSDSTSPYIQEWLVHHLLMGFHKVVLYDSTKPGMLRENFEEVIRPFVELDLAEVIPVDRFAAIFDFNRCREKMLHDGYDWVAQIDTDEFLMVHNPLPYCFGEFLQRFDESKTDRPVGGVTFRWRMMTTVGVVRNSHDKVLLEEALFQGHDIHAHVKPVYRPSKTAEIMQEHYARYQEPYTAVDVKFNKQDGPFFNPQSPEDFSLVECRHFYGRSMESLFYDKLCANNANLGLIEDRMRKMMSWFATNGDVVSVERDQRYVEPLRNFLYG